jgi:hypothetical protein
MCVPFYRAAGSSMLRGWIFFFGYGNNFFSILVVLCMSKERRNPMDTDKKTLEEWLNKAGNTEKFLNWLFDPKVDAELEALAKETN